MTKQCWAIAIVRSCGTKYECKLILDTFIRAEVFVATVISPKYISRGKTCLVLL